MIHWYPIILFITTVLSFGDTNGKSFNLNELNGGQMGEFRERKIVTANLTSVNKINKCKVCLTFLDDLKAVIGEMASPNASQIMVANCEEAVGDRIVFEPVCEFLLRELVRILKWLNEQIDPKTICQKVHLCV